MSENTHKAERLASAIYLLTSFFIEQEPMKWKLRTLASELVSYSNTLRDNLSSDTTSKIRAEAVSREIESLMRVSKSSGLVSDANHSLLVTELVRYVESLSIPLGISAVLEEKSSQEAMGRIERRVETPTQSIKDKTSESPKSGSHEHEYLPSVSTTAPAHSEGQSSAQVPSPGRKAQLKEYGAVSVKKNARQSTIISLLKRKKEIMIKDVSTLISDCSEKTIQRELLSMVKAGILNKSGEKRWSKYSLA